MFLSITFKLAVIKLGSCMLEQSTLSANSAGTSVKSDGFPIEIPQIWRNHSNLTYSVRFELNCDKSANSDGTMILFIDLSLKIKFGNYKHVLQVFQLRFRSYFIFLVKVNKLKYVKIHLIGKLVCRSGRKKTILRGFFSSSLKGPAGHNLYLRLIKFDVHEENLI